MDKILGAGGASTSVNYRIEGIFVDGDQEPARIDKVFERNHNKWSGGVTYRTNEQTGAGVPILKNVFYIMRPVTFTFDTEFVGHSVTDLAEMRLYLETWGIGSLLGYPDGEDLWSQTVGHKAIELYANGDQNHFDDTTI